MKKLKEQRKGGFIISKIHQIAGRIFTKILKDHKIEINPAQGRIMFVLWQNDKILFDELAKKTSLGKSTLTSMLDRLEEMDHIKRIRSKSDRRKIFITTTEKDRKLHEKYLQVSEEMNALYYSGFTDKEIDEFEEFLIRIFDNLSNYE